MPTSRRSTAAREKNMQPCNNCRQHKYGVRWLNFILVFLLSIRQCEFIDERTCGRCKSKGIPCVRILKSKRSRTQSTVVTANVSSGASSNVGPPPTEVDLALGSSLEHPQSFPLPIASGVLPYVVSLSPYEDSTHVRLTHLWTGYNKPVPCQRTKHVIPSLPCSTPNYIHVSFSYSPLSVTST